MNSRLTSALLLLANLAASAHATRIVGSDIAGPVVAGELTARATEAGTQLSADFTGGFDGLRELRGGKASAALVFLRKDEKLPEVSSGKWASLRIAFQPVYVVVPKANKATSIDVSTLAGMYGETADDQYDTWRCLRESGLSQTPLLFMPNPAKGLTVSAFKSEVLRGGNYRKSVRFANTDADAESRALSTQSAIVLLPHPPGTANLKTLSVADVSEGKTGRAYAPTPSSLNSGDYPILVTLFILFPKYAKSEAAPLAKILLSDSVAKLLEAKGLVPVSENIRKKSIQSLDSDQ